MIQQHYKGFRSVGLTTAFLMMISIVGCNSSGGNQPGSLNSGTEQVVLPSGLTGAVASGNGSTPGSSTSVPAGSAVVGDGCHATDGKTICLGLKYVSYKNSSNVAVVSQANAISNLKTMNQLFKQCGIQFQIDKYLAVNPEEDHLDYATSSSGELDTIRSTYQDDSTLLIVTTGSWSGSLGSGSANAWTQMPGSLGPFGAILEASVSTYANIIAHEVGHYLNLDHESNNSNLMSPVIYSSSTELDASQCSIARAAADDYWQKMQR